MQSKKHNKYAALTSVVRRLASGHKLDFEPFFLTPIISSLGFMNQDFVNLTKFIVDRFKHSQKYETDNLDGMSPKVLKGRFRVRVKNAVCFAILKGNAMSVYNQGVRYTSKPP